MGVPVHIVDTGVANIASMRSALLRLGRESVLTSDAGAVGGADALVLPGVGAFGRAMERLRERGLNDALRDRIARGAPTLAICLGMQLLCAASEEARGVEGLGVVDEMVRRFPRGARAPQLGWNEVMPRDAVLVSPGHAYFANSFRLTEAPAGWAVATTDYAGTFVSVLERGAVLACQFHPELSGAWGLALLERWLVRAQSGVAAC